MTFSPDHERLQANLAAAASGRLQGDERREIEEHLAHCAECAATLAFAKEIVALTPHPAILELRGYALDPAASRSAAIDAHVQGCASCALEVTAWRRRHPRRAPWLFAAGAVAAAGLLLWFWLGPLDREIPSRDSGVPQMLTFSGALRGPAGESVPEIDPGRDVEIRAEWIPLEAFEEVGPVSLEIARRDGPTVWSHRFDAGQVVAILGGGGGFSAVVPAGTLTFEVHELRLSRVSRPDDPPVIQASFLARDPAQRQSPDPASAPQ